MEDRYVDEREAARFLGCSTAALRRWRRIGRGADFARLGRLIRYKKSTLETFALENTQGRSRDESRAEQLHAR